MIVEMGKLGWQCTASPAKPSNKSVSGNVGGVLSGVKKYVDNRPCSACADHEGKVTNYLFLTARTFTIERVEVQALSGYIEGGGLVGINLRTLGHADHQTRGGKDLFIWALDANITPEKFEVHKLDSETKTWLDKMGAEIIKVANSSFTCRAGDAQGGGSMIDYFIVSKGFGPAYQKMCGHLRCSLGPSRCNLPRSQRLSKRGLAHNSG